jgi:tRNA modification GTPase
VADVPGTTRDAVTELVDIDGLPVILTDTAGLRDSSDQIESEGVRRARELIKSADLVISVVDLAGSKTEDPSLPEFRIVVLNKSDLVDREAIDGVTGDLGGAVAVSARTGEGVEELCHRLALRLGSSWLQGNEAAVTRQRQHEALVACRTSLVNARQCIEIDEPLEIAAIELREASAAIDELVGRVYDEDILNRIFSEFCIGK